MKGYLPNYAVQHIVSRTRNRLSAGYNHGLFLHYNSKLYSWGVDSGGCLGRVASASNPLPSLVEPVDLPTNISILQFSSSYYSNLVLTTDAVYTWGQNDYGVDADGTTTNNALPSKVFSWDLQGPKRVEFIASGAYTHFAVDDNGKAYGWGRNAYGQLGDRTFIDKKRPVDIYMRGALSDQRVFKICAGIQHTVILTRNNTLFAFGDNQYGQLGNAGATSTSSEAVPVKQSGVLSGKTIVDIACGNHHTLVLTSDGKVFAWGYNGYGQLGDSTGSSRNEPVAMYASSSITSKNVVRIWTRMNVAFAWTSDNLLYSWGANDNYQLGVGSGQTTPFYYPVTAASQGYSFPSNIVVLEVVIMYRSTLLLGSDGNIYGAGYSSTSKELMTNQSPSSTFTLSFNQISVCGFVMERRVYPYFETDTQGYQFMGESYLLFPDNGFYLFKKNLTDPLKWKMVEYSNTTNFFRGSIYNTHTLRVGDYVYMYGGIVNNTVSKTIYRAPVSNIESGWELMKQTMPFAVASGASMVIDDAFFIYGGLTALFTTSSNVPQQSLTATNSILRVQISTPWVVEVVSTTLPVSIYSASVGKVKNSIVMLGGRTASGAPYADILRASYLFPTQFENMYSVLPFQISDGSVVISNNYIYIFGGYYSGDYPNTAGDWNNQVIATPASEPIGSWIVTGDLLPYSLTGNAVLSGDYLYMYGNDARVLMSYPLSDYSKTMYQIKYC